MTVTVPFLGPLVRAAVPVGGAAMVLLLAGISWPLSVAHFTFLALLGSLAILTVDRVLGGRPALGVGALLVLLTAGVALGIGPTTTVAPPAWPVSLTHDGAARHTLRLPLATPKWDETWSRAAAGYVRLCLAPADPPGDPGLVVTVNGTELPPLQVEPASCQGGVWYRTAISRSLLDSAPRSVVEVRRRPEFQDNTHIVASYSYRPSGGPQASAYFDGRAWRAEIPGPSMDSQRTSRFIIELWLLDRRGWPVATWY